MRNKLKEINKSLPQDKYLHASALVTKVVEPKIRRLVEELNVVLAKHGTVAGCEIQWFFDKLTDTGAAKQGDDGDED
jgi:hypothetical protein